MGVQALIISSNIEIEINKTNEYYYYHPLAVYIAAGQRLVDSNFNLVVGLHELKLVGA